MKARLFAVAAVAFVSSTTAYAERPEDRFWLNLGGFLAHIDSHLNVDNQKLGLDGSHVDFERDLGLEHSRLMPKATAGARIGKRFRVEADYFSLSRNGILNIDEEIRIDDTIFPIGARVRTDFDTDIYRLAAGYSFLMRDNAELGVSAGAHVSKASFDVRAEVLGFELEEHRSKSAPLPNVGIYGNIDLFGPVALQGTIDAFKMKAGNYKGALLDSQLSLEARFHKNIGVGLGYRYAYYKVKADSKNWRGKLTYNYYGPIAYVEFAF